MQLLEGNVFIYTESKNAAEMKYNRIHIKKTRKWKVNYKFSLDFFFSDCWTLTKKKKKKKEAKEELGKYSILILLFSLTLFSEA